MVRTTIGTIAEAELSVRQSETVDRIVADQTTTVPSSGSVTTSVAAPTGELISVTALSVLVKAPNGASSGTHSITLRGPDDQTDILIAESQFNTRVSISKNIIRVGNSDQEPASKVVQQANILAINLDDDGGLTLTYENNTDVSQSKPRQIDIVGIERGVST